MKLKANKAQILIMVIVALAVLLSIILPYPISDIAIYFTGTVACLILARSLGIRPLADRPSFARAVFVAFPAVILAINNFPIVAWVIESPSFPLVNTDLILSVLLCFTCALFEETMFRYFVLDMILKKRRDSKKDYIIGIVIAGAIFGLYHIFNFFFGASIPYTLLQVTYTALIGAMLCVVYDKTKRLWICVLIHFVYNVGGESVRLLGVKEQWVASEVILTVAVSVLVLIFYLTYVYKDKKYNI